MKEWLYWHFPIITTRSKRDDYTFRFIKEAEYNIHGRYEKFIRFKDKSTWAAINQVISSLKELRKNTWDIDRVDKAIKWLKDNFEVRNEVE